MFDAPPKSGANLATVLDRDLAQPLKIGELAPGTGAGMTIGFVHHGARRVIAWGTARPDSIFEIGSISKAFTGLLLAQLAEQGRTDLHEPLRSLLPPGTVAKPAGREITLLDLVTQHSGLPRNPDNIHPADMANPLVDYHAVDLYQFLAKHGAGRPPDAPYLYSNLGFALLGQALVERAGTAYPVLLEDEIARPLGLKDTVVVLSPEQQSRLLQGHDAAHRAVHEWNMDVFAGSGGIRSTAGDMLAFLDAELHPTGTLREAVVQSQRLRADVGSGTRIALAWHYTESTGTYWAIGGTGGFSSHAFFNPRDDYAGVVLLNAAPGGDAPFVVLMGEHLRARLAGEPAISLDSVEVPAVGGAYGVVRSFAAYWIAMLAAGAFIFCSILGMQGIAAQLPRRWFLRVSSFLQLATFCLLVCAYFLQRSPAYALVLGPAQPILAWIPSYWFVGLFQQLNGSLHPALAPFARRAWMGLALAVCGTAVGYALSYLRTLRSIVEEPDIVPGSRRGTWLPPFGRFPRTAIVQFSVRTLLRSRQHRMILAFYLGLGFAMTVLFLKTPLAQKISGSADDPWGQTSVALLASSIVLMGFWVVGTRVVFSMPLDLRSNWVFQMTPVRGGRELRSARRRALIALSAGPAWTVCAVVLLSRWPWTAAAGHLLVLGLIGLILVEWSLQSTPKIPFTCSYLPGKSRFHMMFWLCISLLFILIAKAAEFERHALTSDRVSYAAIVGVLIALVVLIRWRTAARASSGEVELQFEEAPNPTILSLGLHRDGVLPIEP
jgi:CubicO group peptidase (beta-lactamase class C family)